jgi:hypothetical protein
MIQYNNKTDGIIYLPKTTHILISFSNTLLMYLTQLINSMYLQNDIHRLLFSPLYYNWEKKNYNK